MYDALKYVFPGLFVLMGLMMLINPEKATKPMFRTSLKAINRTRKSGIALLICGLVLIVLYIIE